MVPDARRGRAGRHACGRRASSAAPASLRVTCRGERRRRRRPIVTLVFADKPLPVAEEVDRHRRPGHHHRGRWPASRGSASRSTNLEIFDEGLKRLREDRRRRRARRSRRAGRPALGPVPTRNAAIAQQRKPPRATRPPGCRWSGDGRPKSTSSPKPPQRPRPCVSSVEAEGRGHRRSRSRRGDRSPTPGPRRRTSPSGQVAACPPRAPEGARGPEARFL